MGDLTPPFFRASYGARTRRIDHIAGINYFAPIRDAHKNALERSQASEGLQAPLPDENTETSGRKPIGLLPPEFRIGGLHFDLAQ